jgi:hypothetical protein
MTKLELSKFVGWINPDWVDRAHLKYMKDILEHGYLCNKINSYSLNVSEYVDMLWSHKEISFYSSEMDKLYIKYKRENKIDLVVF